MGLILAIFVSGLSLYVAWYIRDNGGTWEDYIIPVIFAGLMMLSAIVGLIWSGPTRRAQFRAKHQTGWRDPDAPLVVDENAFDADAVIARYLAKRPNRPAPEGAADTDPAPADPRPTFGKRTT